MNIALDKSWISLYKDLLNIIKNLKEKYKKHPTLENKRELLTYLKEQRLYLSYFFSGEIIDNSILDLLDDKTKKKYLEIYLNNLLLKNGKKCIISIDDKKVTISKKYKDLYLKYYNILKRIDEENKVEEIKETEILNENQAYKVKSAQKSSRFSARLAVTFMTFLTLINATKAQSISINDYNNQDVEIEKEVVSYEMECFDCGYRSVEVKLLTQKYYHNTNCPNEWQDMIFELSEKWELPDYLIFTLIDKESNGEWSTVGKISQTNDYGLPQINIGNMRNIEKNLGYTKEDILYDVYKSLDAMCYLVKLIFDHYGYTKDNYDFQSVCGTYNGWVKWRSISRCVHYVNSCIDIYNEKYSMKQDLTDLEYVRIRK